MSRGIWGYLLLLGSISAVGADERWHRSLEEALAAAKAQQKPVFLVFRCER